MLMHSYDNLYLDILKIGRSSIGEGLSYHDLKSQLALKGYDFENDCIEMAVKRWFFDSFHHILSDHSNISFEELGKHLDCNFIMTGDACLKLLSFEKTEDNLKLMRESVKWAFIAVAVSLLIQIADKLLST